MERSAELGKVNVVTQKDRQEAFKCYKRAAQLGSARAMNNLALMLEKGFDGQPPDAEAAYALYTQATKLGDKNAPVNFRLLSKTLGADKTVEQRISSGLEQTEKVLRALLGVVPSTES